MARSYYCAPLSEFLIHEDDFILGKLARHHGHDLEANQKRAWLKQISILRTMCSPLAALDAHIYFEFSIPRMGKRADVIVLVQGTVFVLEFKVGASQYHAADINQTVDYALDLKNFHEGSHDLVIVPVLVATEAQPIEPHLTIGDDQVAACLKANKANLQNVLEQALSTIVASYVDADAWANSLYKPTPTIIQAAQALYRGHDVAEISRSGAGAENLTVTANCIANVIEHAKTHGEKAICFVTGVPGAGKTLAGLNIANSRMNAHEDEHAVFLSGNGPLVDVLREALARDERKCNGVSAEAARRKASTFIQNIHHFRDYNLDHSAAPVEKVVVFDEAQRAWHQQKLVSFMKTKKGIGDFQQSEPEFLISVMDRHDDWCVIVCLIGGGQEINYGEAGLSEWFSALQYHFSHWKV